MVGAELELVLDGGASGKRGCTHIALTTTASALQDMDKIRRTKFSEGRCTHVESVDRRMCRGKCNGHRLSVRADKDSVSST